VITSRYNLNDWNVYVAQSSDGDNYRADHDATIAAMHALLPLTQYFAYVEIGRSYAGTLDTDLWNTYEILQDVYSHLNMRIVNSRSDIWKVFKDLFSKDHTNG